ncbi:oligosaccharide flippase family protein [Radiobacillus sp. PE A8.2]|uniref:putative polysaccharide biosynthesis protein n=1 Tax=Radiobacillus sp. PE A8.2 TaxID=3380349 RepID=UPI00388F1F89
MENQQATKEFFQGALILTIAGLLSKVISAGYRVPLQNITGDVGFYIYQQIYPFLGMALMLALYGFPAAISKLVAEHEQKHQLSLTSFYIPVFCLLAIINLFYFSVIYINAGRFAEWMGDDKLVHSIQVAALSFLLIPFTSIFRGVFQGLNNMRPTAVSQLLEQVVRVVIIIVVAVVIVSSGRQLYDVGAGAAYGSVFGGMVAFVILFVVWLRNKPFVKKRTVILWKVYLKAILIYGLFIGLNHMMLLLIQFTDAFTLIPGLLKQGFSLDEAKIIKGVFDRGQPLIQLGTVIGSSIALAVIPSVTKTRMEQQPIAFAQHIQSTIRISFYLSAAATAGLIAIFPYANTLLFQNDLGTTSLRVLSLVMLLSSLAITISSILQGLNNIYITAVFIVIGIITKWMLNVWLIPYIGVIGSAIATVLSVSVILVLNVVGLKRMLPRVRLFSIPWRAFILALLSMLIWVIVVNKVVEAFMPLTTRISHFIHIVIVCSVGGILYIVVLFRMNGFSEQEANALPLGRRLKRR